MTEPQQPCQTSFIYVKLNVGDLQTETPGQHHMPQPHDKAALPAGLQ